MGTWGVGAFDNDTAGDWAYGLEETDDMSLIESTLGLVVAAKGDELDADAASEALAACEVVARLKGNAGDSDESIEEIDAWVAAHSGKVTPALVESATVAIDRILTAPSELLALWEESDDAAAWRASVADLRARVVR